MQQTAISSGSVAKQTILANELLANARSIREQAALESADANCKLSEAFLAVVMHNKRVETTACLLALANTCVGQIRAQMHAHGIPIHLPSMSSNEVTSMSDVNGEAIRGQSLRSQYLGSHLLMRY